MKDEDWRDEFEGLVPYAPAQTKCEAPAEDHLAGLDPDALEVSALREAFAALDGEPDVENQVLPRKTMPGWHILIPSVLESIARYEEQNKKLLYPKLRKAERDVYKEERNSEGKEVRKYDTSKPWVPGETAEDRKLRLGREAYRESVGKTEAELRVHTRLKQMTPEEKKAHERERDARNKRAQRARPVPGQAA